MKFNRMFKLQTKLTLSHALLIVLVIVSIYLTLNTITSNAFKKYVIQKRENNIEKIVQKLQEGYVNESEKWNIEILRSISKIALENDLIIIVDDKNKQPVWNTWRHEGRASTSIVFSMSKNMKKYDSNFKGGYQVRKLSLQVSNEDIGFLRVGYYGPFAYSSDDLEFIKSLTKSLLIIAVIALTLAIILAIVISSRLTSPISKISLLAKKISHGDFSSQIDIHSSTVEIENLITDINLMSKNLNRLDLLRKQFSADIAHELRTPVTTLQSHLETILDGIWEADEQRLTSCFEEVKRISRLINDLEHSFNVESNDFSLNKTDILLNDFIKHIMLSYEAEFKAKGLYLVFDNNYKGSINADHDRLLQIFHNVLYNSLKYTQTGGVTVKINAEKEEDKEYIKFEIFDTGIGINEKDLPHIFERLYRSDVSRNHHTGGRGLGLAIVKSLVLAHNGKISASSQLKIGTIISIFIPLKSTPNIL